MTLSCNSSGDLGTAGNACYGNGTCNAGLECQKGTCIVQNNQPEPKKEEPAAEKAAEEEPEQKNNDDTSTTMTQTDTPAVVIPSVDGVRDFVAPSDFSGKVIQVRDLIQSKKSNNLALKHHRKRRYEKAIENYKQALIHNPGSIVIRYNLACAFALNGQQADALAMLRQLKAINCDKCRDQLIFARRDKDFKTLRGNQDFESLTSGVQPSIDLSYAAVEVYEAFKSSDFSPLEKYLTPHRKTYIKVDTEDPYSNKPVRKNPGATTVDELAKIKYSYLNGYDITNRNVRKKGTCYAFPPSNKIIPGNKDGYKIKSACFYRDGHTGDITLLDVTTEFMGHY